MSVDLWSWRPSCDDEGCCGDCDKCRKAEEVEEDDEGRTIEMVEAD